MNATVDKNVIPPITDAMGKYWRQPDPSRIQIDDQNALMDQATFDALAEYSATIPTGVYPGKMWKRHDGIYDRKCKPEHQRWLLGWFGEEFTKGEFDYCSNNWREIIIV
jgi:hypothetical protein